MTLCLHMLCALTLLLPILHLLTLHIPTVWLPTPHIPTLHARMQDAYEDLLLQYHVDLSFQGHHHSYQRTCPVHKNKCRGYGDDGVPLAPVHLVIGNAGAGLSINVHTEQPEVRPLMPDVIAPACVLCEIH